MRVFQSWSFLRPGSGEGGENYKQGSRSGNGIVVLCGIISLLQKYVHHFPSYISSSVINRTSPFACFSSNASVKPALEKI